MDDKTWLSSLGEIKVTAELVRLGYEVFTSSTGKSSCDVIFIQNSIPKRVQIKCCRTKAAGRSSWSVQLKSVRSNKRQNKITRFDSSKCDLVAVYIEPLDRIFFLDPHKINGTCSINIQSDDTPESNTKLTVLESVR